MKKTEEILKSPEEIALRDQEVINKSKSFYEEMKEVENVLLELKIEATPE